MNEKIHEALDLCLRLNPGKTQKSITGNRPTVGLDFRGDLGYTTLFVWPNGYDPGASIERLYRIESGFAETEIPERKRMSMDDILNMLRDMCKEWWR